MNYKSSSFIFIFFLLFNFNVYSENILERSNHNHIFYIVGNFDKDAAERAQNYCKHNNLNTIYFRSKDGKTFDVQTKLFGKSKWRFFCANTYDDAKRMFNAQINNQSFKSKLRKINISDIDVLYWKTKSEPSKSSQPVTDNNSSEATFGQIFVFLIVIIGLLYFILRKKQKVLTDKKIVKNHSVKKNNSEIIDEWKDKIKNI